MPKTKRTDLPSYLFQSRFLPSFCISPVVWNEIPIENFGPLIMIFDGVCLSEGFDEAAEGAEATVAS